MNKYARVAESADARDLKSLGLTAVSVQIRSRAPKIERDLQKSLSILLLSHIGDILGTKNSRFWGRFA